MAPFDSIGPSDTPDISGDSGSEVAVSPVTEVQRLNPLSTASLSGQLGKTLPGSNASKYSTSAHVTTSASLEGLQSSEQKLVLETVARVRKCGLESVLSLPQLVVCGDQSAGKSSVLEALTEMPFPRSDTLCTRFATEINLRHAVITSLTIKVIPDSKRPPAEQATIRAFKESFKDFSELPRVIDAAKLVMGITSDGGASKTQNAFARDVLSIEVEGPTQPNLTLVDIPGLISSSTSNTTSADIETVASITDHYISQERTICLAVVSASHDYANQKILEKVRKVDPQGQRTLGIITKPDIPPAGSGSQTSFIELAQNKDIFFKLGWHVIKNRKFEEGDCSLIERKAAEAIFFRTSNFKSLPSEHVGIDSLRRRLSILLFQHVKKELPKLRQDLEDALGDTFHQLSLLGERRGDETECKAYLTQISLRFYEICKAAVEGHYELKYFRENLDASFSLQSSSTIRRIRAVSQMLNTQFSEELCMRGHKYHFEAFIRPDKQDNTQTANKSKSEGRSPNGPIFMTKQASIDWVAGVLIRNRGRELVGNFNPLLIGELFWEQSSRWRDMATSHVELMIQMCQKFVKELLFHICAEDAASRLWASHFADELKKCQMAAFNELEFLLNDLSGYPLNYNHYYTDSIAKRRKERKIIEEEEGFVCAECGEEFEEQITVKCPICSAPPEKANSDMNGFSCDEALDCLYAIYKVTQKTFISNVTIQVVERHIIRGLEKIFSPITVNKLSGAQALAVGSEPNTATREREFLEDRSRKLKEGKEIFKNVMGTSKE